MSDWRQRVTSTSPYQKVSTYGSKIRGSTAYQKTAGLYGKASGFAQKNPMIMKVILVFLTLVGAWGFGSYEVPRFYTYITSHVPWIRKIMHFIMLFVLAYQGLGGTDFWVSLIATAVFFILTEIIKLIENATWPKEEEQDETTAPATPVAAPATPATAPAPTPEPAKKEEPTKEEFAIWQGAPTGHYYSR